MNIIRIFHNDGSYSEYSDYNDYSISESMLQIFQKDRRIIIPLFTVQRILIEKGK